MLDLVVVLHCYVWVSKCGSGSGRGGSCPKFSRFQNAGDEQTVIDPECDGRTVFDAKCDKATVFDLEGDKRTVFDLGQNKATVFDPKCDKATVFNPEREKRTVFDPGAIYGCARQRMKGASAAKTSSSQDPNSHLHI